MSDELRRLLGATRALEEATGVKLAVIGGVARGAWALERNTFDVDVIANTDDLTALIAHAEAARFGLLERKTSFS